MGKGARVYGRTEHWQGKEQKVTAIQSDDKLFIAREKVL